MTNAQTVPDDPIAYFIDDMARHGKSHRTLAAYERVLRQFEAHLTNGQPENPDITSLAVATHRECTAWLHTLRGNAADSTIATYASYLHRFYAYMTKTDVFDANPMVIVLEEMDETIETDPHRRRLSVPDMRAFVASIRHPLDRAIVITLLKTGMRAGELCNLDLRDLRIDANPLDRTTGWTPRAHIESRPDSLYVAPGIDVGQTVHGEPRRAANKRRRGTVVPIDPELRRTLVSWLAIRPDTPSPADPVFVSTTTWGRRLTPNMVHRIVTSHTTRHGWYDPGAGPEENVTPHYFRHFFTTHLRDRTGDRGVVKYLRGDVADDIIDTYTHNWTDRIYDAYLAHIYTLT